jgi:cell division protein FtsB
MSDIDLIPASYRNSLLLTNRLKLFVFVFLILLIIISVSKIVLQSYMSKESNAINLLKHSQAELIKNRAEIDQLQSKYDFLEKRMNILNKLRGGPPVKEVFLAIEHALNDQVWFLDWRFLRAGEYTPAKQEAVNTGYFIIIPADSSTETDGEQRAWKMSTFMKIRARATNHSALSAFVSRLNHEAIIAEVKIISTRTSKSIEMNDAVDFELTVIVRNLAEAI